jgi:uncharacterized RDD family membrane protein YckC
MTAALPSIGPTRPPPGDPPVDHQPFVIGSWNDPTGVMGRRIGAFALDALLGLLLTLLAILATGGLTEERGATSCTQFPGTLCLALDQRVVTGTTATTWSILLVPLLYALVFSVVVQGLTGATPGKAVFGVRVVDAEGRRPGLGRAAARTVLLLVDLLPCCLPLVGLLTASTSAGHRRVGDMVATTFVLDRRDAGRPLERPVPAAAPAPYAPPEPQWDPARNTYVVWDPTRGTWLAFDSAAGLWREI